MEKAIQQLKQAAFKTQRQRYPSVPEYAIAVPRYNDKTANGLTKCIIDWLRFNGHQAERISNMGRPIDGRKRYTDAMGFSRQIGNVTWIPGQGTPGTADISATIAGKSVKIEVKMKDRQSEAQKKYQSQVEAAGGVYIIARTFDGFLDWYSNF